MYRNIIALILFALAVFSAGCGGSGAPPNAAANGTNVNTAIPLDPANMPPGLSATPLPPSTNKTPGIPANVEPLPKGTTPTPGIPSPAELKKGVKPGTTPTPGIPDQETIRKALGRPATNVNTPPPAGSDVPMMKSNRKLGGKPQ